MNGNKVNLKSAFLQKTTSVNSSDDRQYGNHVVTSVIVKYLR